MKMKNIILAGMAVISMAAGGFSVYAKTTENQLGAITSYRGEITRTQTMTEETSKDETAALSLKELQKLGIPEFNLPIGNYTAYQASNLTITETGTILSRAANKGFMLEKGDVVRVNSVYTGKDTGEDFLFTVGYVKDGVYTSLTNGNMPGPCTAWEVLDAKDAGEYKIYYKTDGVENSQYTFDVIITIERA